ncbi:MAG: histone deacetylase, partial [Desulfobacula sp.]|uniref:histone deacetylase family protein n=1 Tax=Desulfobacula sp. TaxID=2593537 RepID=UPI0025BEEC1A
MMLTRENIKQAIDAIGKREPQIAYTLNTMLGKGRIDVPLASEIKDETRPYFLFGDKKTFINKFQFFTSGTPPLEQALLIHYGEMAQKRNLLHRDPLSNPGEHASKTDTAGLSLMLDYEIDLAQALLKEQISSNKTSFVNVLNQRLKRLGNLKKNSPDNPQILCQGVINNDITASFIRFPFSRESLMHAARLNLEFFHIRFLLNCLVSGTDSRLFACIARGELQGLIFLEIIKKLFYKGFEVKYFATSAGSASQDDRRPVKGAGTFIMAGVWMLWKSNFPDVKEIFLESEIQAARFYASIGFHTRGLYKYTLKSPEGRLLTAIAVMAVFSKKTHPSITSHLCKRIPGQIKLLKRKKNINGQRKRALEFIKITLHPASSDLLARTTMRILMKNKSRIPEGETLFALAKAFGRIETKQGQMPPALPVAVIIDKRYWNHLMGVAHLENYRRIKAVEDLLENKCLDGKWFTIAPRLAQKNELTWVHTLEYVEKVEKTAGKSLSSLDFDTQTTEESWSIAQLAAGGVFSLLDGIMSGWSHRGFAFIRPPGHHAGPGKGMGFCIFNNIALGAMYLKQKYKVSRLMIIDIDAHHGNGTQEIFYNTDEVLFISIHESDSFPGTGNVQETGKGKGLGFT